MANHYAAPTELGLCVAPVTINVPPLRGFGFVCIVTINMSLLTELGIQRIVADEIYVTIHKPSHKHRKKPENGHNWRLREAL